MTAALLDHLWQSTLFAGVIWLIMPLFRANSAAVRFWLWFAASVKFLVPLSLFTLAGRHLPALAAPAMPARLVSALQPVAIPFSAGKSVLAMPAPHLMLLDLAVAAWMLGVAMVLGLWLLHWIGLRVHLRRATDLPVTMVVPVKATRSDLEPGLVGIWRPIILLPEGITERLSPTEMEAVMAHELCHLRRRDNLLAAMHMLVEALFWFHPLVWWIGGRLVEEREHACDESVLAAGNQPLVYAEGILKVCRFYVQSPLACASGVSGAALETRVGTILRNSPVNDVESAKGALLICVAALSVMLPLLAGRLGPGSVSGLASRVATAIATQMVPMPAPAAVRPDVRAPKLSAALRIRRHRVLAPALAPVAEVPDAAALPVIVPPAALHQEAPASSDASAPADDSGTIVCRLPQPLPASRFSGPQVCLTKSAWAQLRAQGKDISPDGRSIVDAQGDTRRTQDFLRDCRPTAVGVGASTGNLSTFAQNCF